MALIKPYRWFTNTKLKTNTIKQSSKKSKGNEEIYKNSF